ncbi:MAG TPA: chorismate mutase [Candidatus Dormibacteraeota bacterium]|nr:chorismate mutase [Candidatus Dormibacteraeota bacterium]
MDEQRPEERPYPSDTPMVSACRGVRGATSVEGGGEPELQVAVAELLAQILAHNNARSVDIAAVIFTVPDDLGGINPAAAARAVGFQSVPLLVVREHGGDDRVARCLRVLVLLNTTRTQDQIVHAYLGGAELLRPDLVAPGSPRP